MKAASRVSHQPKAVHQSIVNIGRLFDSIGTMRIAALAFSFLSLSACTKNNPAYCNNDAECTDSGRPFCDIEGQYPESDYTGHACSVTPAGCPIERCGCAPGESLACSGDQVTICAADGHSTTSEICSLGCATSQPRCSTFTPSNDLEAALSDAALQPDVVLPPGSHIDTNLGLVQDSSGASIAVTTTLVSQNGGASMIRALEARSFVIDDVAVSGEYALAFVAPKSIVVRGRIDASAKYAVAGPGGQEAPAVCAGGDTRIDPPGCTGVNCYAKGAGGGGNATSGGAGGGENAFGAPAGTLIPTFVPLVGGCRGGRLFNSDGTTLVTSGGAGGGAVQLVSSEAIRLTTVGLISVGGGGGYSTTGGGSGGTVVLEAPTVELNGAGTGIFANGGAGGGCSAAGADALLTMNPARGPQCSPRSAGDGGTAIYPVTSGEVCMGSCSLRYDGGGGGAVGRVRIGTKDGTYQTMGGAQISAVVTTSMLVVH